MSKKKEKEIIDQKKEEIIIETFQRARSKNISNNDSFTNNENKDNNENDKENNKNISNFNAKEDEEKSEKNIGGDHIKEAKKEIKVNYINIYVENSNNQKKDIKMENKELILNDDNKSDKTDEEKNIEFNSDKKNYDSNKKSNNLKINIANPNRIYKKNSRKIFAQINVEKTKNNTIINTNNLTINNDKRANNNIIPTIDYNTIKSQRNIPKKDTLDFKNISNTIDNIPKTNKNKNTHIKSHTPINNLNFNNNQFEKEIFTKNKKMKKYVKKRNTDEEHSNTVLLNKNLDSLENSFDSVNIYKKRKLNKKEFSQSPIGKIYAPKRALNQRGNSLGKLNASTNAVINKSNININNVNYINNINTIIKNKNDESLISMAYAKKSPIPNRKDNLMRLNNSININNINNINHYMDNDFNNYNNINLNMDMNRDTDNYTKYVKQNNNYNIINNYNYNNNINNNKTKKKYLMPSKTSSMLKKRKQLPKYDEINYSNDNINYNKNNRIRKINTNNYFENNINNYQMHGKNLYNERNYSNNNIPNNQQRMKRKNQVIPSIYPNKENISLSQRYNIYNNYKNNNIDKNYYSNNNNLTNNIIDKYNSYEINNFENNKNNKNDFGNYYIANNNYTANKKLNSSISINIEDLMVLEEKLSEIIYFLKNRKEVRNQCFDFWNYFYNCSLYQRIEKTFTTEQNIEIVKFSINLELLSIMLCYEFSFDLKILNMTYILLLEILELNHRNLMIICENILVKIRPENQKNRWVLKLNKIVQNSKISEQNNFDNLSYVEKIEINTDKINRKLLNILLNYKTEFSPLIMSLMKKITQKNYEEINDFFREYILKVENLESSIVASVLLRTEPNFISHRPPYLQTPRAKPYTLILDLNETLVSFQQTNFSQGILRLRPFLIEFLEEVSYYYELILFTASTEYFAKPIINAIEENKKYFDFIFYRECCIIIGNDFVKDLTRIGRPLDSTIIVDNMQQNFRLQKENGIHIKSFFAQDPNDSALYDLLNILIDIAEEEGDVREGLTKYRNDIVKKVTSNIAKYNI